LNRYYFNSTNDLFNCVQNYIDWYNNERLHSSLEYKTPLEKEMELRKINKKAA
jgi:transposase InsO family protein